MNASFNNKNGEIVELVNTITAAKKSLYQNYVSTVNQATIFRYTYSTRDGVSLRFHCLKINQPN